MRNALIAATMAAIALPAAPALALPVAAAPAPAAAFASFLPDSHGVSSAEAFRQRRYQTTSNGVRYWRGNNGRYYCRKPNGTVGMLIGGAAGALIGRSIDGGRNNTTGTIIGAAGGALLGREVARSRARCR
jgi:uncharacterized protein YcfJ